MERILIIVLFLILCGCQTSTPSHIPAPWQLPGAAIGNVIENASYGARRRKVTLYTSQYYNEITLDIQTGSGGALSNVLDLARVHASRRKELLHALQSEPNIYFSGPLPQNIERLVVAFMVHGN